MCWMQQYKYEKTTQFLSNSLGLVCENADKENCARRCQCLSMWKRDFLCSLLTCFVFVRQRRIRCSVILDVKKNSRMWKDGWCSSPPMTNPSRQLSTKHHHTRNPFLIKSIIIGLINVSFYAEVHTQQCAWKIPQHDKYLLLLHSFLKLGSLLIRM